MKLINKQHFINALFIENKLHPVYNTLKYSFNDKEFVKENELKNHTYEKSLFYFNYCFPMYLKPELGDYKKFRFKLPSFHYKSYGIIIDEKFESAEDYLQSHFSHKLRYFVRKSKSLLDQCFDIKTTVYYGDIERSEYDYIMNKASEFLGARFKQKNESNDNLSQWDMYYNCLFPLINKKKASIFVIYNGLNPIQITINYNINKTCLGHMLIYDVDYSKYSMGHIGVYNTLDWCIKNNYDFLDLGMCTYDYKTKWSNFSYELETQIIFNKNHKILHLLGYILKVLFQIKYFFIDFKFRRRYEKTAKMKKSAPVSDNVEIELLKDFKINDLSKISLKQLDNYKSLRKTINDFLFLQKVHENSIEIYKNSENIFFIKSNENIFKLSL